MNRGGLPWSSPAFVLVTLASCRTEISIRIKIQQYDTSICTCGNGKPHLSAQTSAVPGPTAACLSCSGMKIPNHTRGWHAFAKETALNSCRNFVVWMFLCCRCASSAAWCGESASPAHAHASKRRQAIVGHELSVRGASQQIQDRSFFGTCVQF